mmetsp:Transcript_30637/g.61789  ORF Transcript_30637/g.61789 Transcript_30637/m.61789 type:complete len:271 (-) Transcript_30637:81-893(-)
MRMPQEETSSLFPGCLARKQILSTTSAWQMLGARRAARVQTQEAIDEEPTPALDGAAKQLKLLNPSSAWKTLGNRFHQRAKATAEVAVEDEVRPFSRAGSAGSPPETAEPEPQQDTFTRSVSAPRAGSPLKVENAQTTAKPKSKKRTVVEMFWEQEMQKMNQALAEAAARRVTAEEEALRVRMDSGDKGGGSFRSGSCEEGKSRSCSKSASSREGSFRRMRRGSSACSSAVGSRRASLLMRRASVQGQEGEPHLFQGLMYTDAAHLLFRR